MLTKTPQVGVWGSTSKDLDVIKAELDDHLYHVFNGVVQSGPFNGMKLRREVSWKGTSLAPMLLGCYEAELHGALEQEISRLRQFQRAPKIVVLGAAEGYYAIGLKLRLPNADVFVVEPDEEALATLEKAAQENAVSVIMGPLEQALDAPDLIVSDCEGSEVVYFDPEKFPGIVGAHALVEIHNFPTQRTDDLLLERFRSTHWIDFLVEGPRNPNANRTLCGMTTDYRWMAVNENRPCLMGWFYMRSKGMRLS